MGVRVSRLPKGNGRGNCPNPVPQRRNLSFSKPRILSLIPAASRSTAALPHCGKMDLEFIPLNPHTAHTRRATKCTGMDAARIQPSAHSGSQREPECEHINAEKLKHQLLHHFPQRKHCVGRVSPTSSRHAVFLRQPPLLLPASRCSNQRRPGWAESCRADSHF